MNLYNLLSLLLSVAAIAFSVVSFRYSHATQKVMEGIESAREQDRVTQQKRAQLNAELVEKIIRESSIGHPLIMSSLRISNLGQAIARNVSVYANGEDVLKSEHNGTHNGTISAIGPLSYVDVFLSIGSRITYSLSIEIQWDDDTGVRGRYSTTLKV